MTREGSLVLALVLVSILGMSVLDPYMVIHCCQFRCLEPSLIPRPSILCLYNVSLPCAILKPIRAGVWDRDYQLTWISESC